MREIPTGGRAASIVLAIAVLGIAPSIARAQPRFGVASFTTTPSGTQASAHPDVSAGFALDTDALGNPVEQLKNASVLLPAGLVGNPSAVERCPTKSFQQLNCAPTAQVGVLEASFVVCRGISTPLQASAEAGETTITVENTAGLCASAEGGTITIGTGASAETAQIAFVTGPNTLQLAEPLQSAHAVGEPVAHKAEVTRVPLSLFNLQPSGGHVATFGASLLFLTILVQVDVSPDGRLAVTLNDISTLLPIESSSLTLWGVPADPSHDAHRCSEFGICGASGGSPAPFTTYPSDCESAPLQTELSVESWQGGSASGVASEPAPTGCGVLRMAPSLSVVPSTTQRDTPAGYGVSVEVPQNPEPSGTATPDVRSIAVSFPAGTSLSPPVANGLEACTQAQFAALSCPDAAKVGSTEVTSPLLGERLTGGLYIGAQSGPTEYRLYTVISAGSVTLQLAGRLEVDERDGDVTAVFEDLPQLPFSRLELRLFGGAYAPLANPATCGPATSTGQIVSYAGQSAGPSSTFTVDADGGGGACPPSEPFSPGFSAGTLSPLAGSGSPFTLTVARADGEQGLSSFAVKLPLGLVGLLSSVGPCPEALASAAACGVGAEVGSATIAAGAGSQSLRLPGRVYLTGPYRGAPFGLAVVVQATVGPFSLGTVVVRARVLVDPSDLGLTVIADRLPQMLSGIPLRLRTINLTLDRPGFIVNPTSCAAQTVNATIESSRGASAAATTPFRAAGCGDLRFATRLRAATRAKAGAQGNGASLDLDISKAANATANLRAVTIALPPQLRPRLGTLGHACPAATAARSLAACPAQSLIGRATVATPVLAVPLTGSVYLIANGGTRPPSLTMVLRGEGIEARLDGSLAVSRKGAVSAAFQALPDVPIDSFALTLPSGPHSILGAVEGLCAKPLKLAYALTDQAGASVKASTVIAVSGCPPRHAVGHKRPPRRRTAKGARPGDAQKGAKR